MSDFDEYGPAAEFYDEVPPYKQRQDVGFFVQMALEYGGPVRAVFPQLWGYKSAKSLVAVDFLPAYESGYWEQRGYEGDARITATKLYDLNSRTTRAHAGGEVTW